MAYEVDGYVVLIDLCFQFLKGCNYGFEVVVWVGVNQAEADVPGRLWLKKLAIVIDGHQSVPVAVLVCSHLLIGKL